MWAELRQADWCDSIVSIAVLRLTFMFYRTSINEEVVSTIMALLTGRIWLISLFLSSFFLYSPCGVSIDDFEFSL
jgi:hypothetical protein